MISAPLRVQDVFRREGEFLVEAVLACTEPACGARYPLLDGVPVVLRDVGSWWRRSKPALSEARAAGPELREYFGSLERSGPERVEERALLGAYKGFHYAEYIDAPRPEGFSFDSSSGAYWEAVAKLARPAGAHRYSRSIDLGCSVGRYTFDLARVSDLAFGVDLDFGKVSAAARIQRSRAITYERRERGRVFRRVEGSYDPPQNALFLVGDALDPPFPGESFDLVGALNLLDNVCAPLTLLGQADALLRAGGILVLGAPYEWRAEIAEPAEWLENESLDAAALLRRILEGKAADRMGLRYTVEDEIGELPWALRGHSRRWTIFLSHVMRARKNGAPGREAA